MNIRQENSHDYAAIYELVKTAFETAKVKDGDEQDFVNRLRDSDKYIPSLALVAEEDGKIIGHIMVTKTWVTHGDEKHEVLYLAPVSVLLEYRKKGVGSELIRRCLTTGKEMGYKAVFLAGDPGYYHRFGFEATIKHGIKCSIDLPEEFNENIMVCELIPGGLKGVTGVVEMSR